MFRVETNISTRPTVAEAMEEHGVDYTIRIPANKRPELGPLTGY